MVLNCVNWFKFYSYTYERVIYFTKMCKVLLTLVTNFDFLSSIHSEDKKNCKVSLYIYID